MNLSNIISFGLYTCKGIRNNDRKLTFQVYMYQTNLWVMNISVLWKHTSCPCIYILTLSFIKCSVLVTRYLIRMHYCSLNARAHLYKTKQKHIYIYMYTNLPRTCMYFLFPCTFLFIWLGEHGEVGVILINWSTCTIPCLHTHKHMYMM